LCINVYLTFPLRSEMTEILHFVFFLDRMSVRQINRGSLDIAELFIHMRAFPVAATGSAVQAIAGDMVAIDSVKDVASMSIAHSWSTMP